MNGSIQLHPEKGFNPALTYCRRCKGDAQELLLMGRYDKITVCNEAGCEMHLIGGGKCPKHPYAGSTFLRNIEEYERLPSSTLCESCEEQVEVVKAGGVFWKCEKDERHMGAIRKSEFADDVRKAHGIEAPDACGVLFTEKECPVCAPGVITKEEPT